MRNPYEDDFAVEHPDRENDEHAYPCACGDPSCWCDDRDATNVRIGKAWYAQGCAEKHPVEVGPVTAAILADEEFDQFNRTRR